MEVVPANYRRAREIYPSCIFEENKERDKSYDRVREELKLTLARINSRTPKKSEPEHLWWQLLL